MTNYIRIVKGYIFHRKIRTLLTIIGVFIGITAVFALISIGQGAQNFIDEQFKIAGSNRLQISPGGGSSSLSFAPGSSFVAAKLYEKDVSVVERSRGVEFAHGYLVQSVTLNFGGEKKGGYLLGVHTDSKTLNDIKQSEYFVADKGRELRSGDKNNVLIGSATANGFFGKNVSVGNKLNINGIDFTVVGITKKTGNPFQDQRVIMPFDTAKEMFGTDDTVSIIVAVVRDGFNPDDVAGNIKKDLRNERGVKKGEEDFSVTTSAQLAATFSSILGVITVFIIGIAAISLIVGSVGIMNSMYTSVTERTRDIGIMKAIGAKNSDILITFVIESGILGLAGGIAGVIFGALIGKGTEIVAQASNVGIFQSVITPELVIGSLLFSFLIGALSGLFPAIEASRLRPVEAFRYKK